MEDMMINRNKTLDFGGTSVLDKSMHHRQALFWSSSCRSSPQRLHPTHHVAWFVRLSQGTPNRRAYLLALGEISRVRARIPPATLPAMFQTLFVLEIRPSGHQICWYLLVEELGAARATMDQLGSSHASVVIQLQGEIGLRPSLSLLSQRPGKWRLCSLTFWKNLEKSVQLLGVLL